ncbi:MAG: peptide-methionine (S)-S-oxide reductase MsrA [Alphaproteobacteria bacterium]|nr:peptide-methionine (S)-S-oxide reductase MsrA [Alphaproteobacteria bacterium]
MNETITNFTNVDSVIFASGCFWCTEAFFQRLEGVLSVESGYSGGTVDNPTYEEVCDKSTGHAECIKLKYDTTKISFDELLEVFFKTHDPTTLNRQGNDAGPQYRSAIFYYNQFQKDKSMYYIETLNAEKVYDNPIVTQVEPAKAFYLAENYHQNFYNNNSNQGYCKFVIEPKLEKFEKIFKNKLKKHN